MKKLFILFVFISFSIFAQEQITTENTEEVITQTVPTKRITEDALVLYRQGNYSRSVEVCKKELIQSNRTLAQRMDSYAVMCWSLIKLSKYDEVIENASIAIKLNPKDQRLFEILAEGYFYKGSNKSALNNFEKYIRLAPNGDRIGLVYSFIGEIYIREKSYNMADVALSTAVHYDNTNSNWWTSLGFAKESSGKKASAINAYKRALKLNPNNSRASQAMARLQS